MSAVAVRLAAMTLVLPLLSALPPVFHATSEVVRLDVSVTRHGRPVTGLTRGDFTITDNGATQQVQDVVPDDGPLSVILALDASGSMAGEKLQDLKQAALSLIRSLRPVDRVALVTFSQQILIGVPLTGRHDAAIASLQASGATALRDAVFTAVQLRPEDESRVLVLVFSDVEDDASWLSPEEVLRAVRRSDLLVDAVQISDESGPRAGESATAMAAMRARARAAGEGTDFLRQAAAESGGDRWFSESAQDLRKVFAQALEAMRARYILSFDPGASPHPGWHDLRVTLKGKSADVKARRGYFVP